MHEQRPNPARGLIRCWLARTGLVVAKSLANVEGLQLKDSRLAIGLSLGVAWQGDRILWCLESVVPCKLTPGCR